MPTISLFTARRWLLVFTIGLVAIFALPPPGAANAQMPAPAPAASATAPASPAPAASATAPASPAPAASATAPASPAPAASATAPGSPAPAAPATAPASPAPAAPAPPPANFGSPPAGEIPILFNDHHVYSKPDELKRGRVLAALVRGGTILIPLRSMFEQMGATVSYDPASKTADVTKPGSDVKVTVGKPEVIINGETRPLDVPPEIYQGTILVPVRVISEGMGAYVQWVPDRRIVVVRYLPPTPPPPPAPPPPPPSPTPSPTPAPPVHKSEIFLAADYMYGGKIYNEFSPGNTENSSYHGRAAIEFNVGVPLMVEADFRQYQYPHNQGIATPPAGANGIIPCTVPGDQGCVTVIGGGGQTFVPAFRARENDTDFRLAVKVLDPRIYVGVGYQYRSTNWGYPKFDSFGFGAEKLPDLDQFFSIYGSYWYYTNSRGKYSNIAGQTFTVAYTVQKYQIGGTISIPKTPIFIDLGFLGERGNAKSESVIGYTHNGFYSGLGLWFHI
jgi:Copper amine oxidase N-terminal domain